MNTANLSPRLEQIEAAIRDLMPESADPSHVASSMATWVHVLDVTGGSYRKPREASAERVGRELAAVAEAARKLVDALNNLSTPAASAFQNPHDLRDRVNIIGIIAEHADPEGLLNFHHAKAEAVTTEMTVESSAVDLALQAAFVFMQATGSVPGRRYDSENSIEYGPFIDFVSRIFKIRGVKNSPATSAREALRVMWAMAE